MFDAFACRSLAPCSRRRSSTLQLGTGVSATLVPYLHHPAKQPCRNSVCVCVCPAALPLLTDSQRGPDGGRALKDSLASDDSAVTDLSPKSDSSPKTETKTDFSPSTPGNSSSSPQPKKGRLLSHTPRGAHSSDPLFCGGAVSVHHLDELGFVSATQALHTSRLQADSRTENSGCHGDGPELLLLQSSPPLVMHGVHFPPTGERTGWAEHPRRSWFVSRLLNCRGCCCRSVRVCLCSPKNRHCQHAGGGSHNHPD